MSATTFTQISESEEHDFQFSSKRRAQMAARVETIRTSRRHQVIFTTTYRDLTPRTCWYVCLAMEWRNGELATI